MKYIKRVLLSLIWILIPSAIMVFLSYQEITLGAIPTVILHAPFFYLLSLTWRGKFDRKKLPPAIPADKTTDDSIPDESAPEATIQPKKPLFERYDTYITCPGCGQLVPKGSKHCDCGYDFSGPAAKLGFRIRRASPVLLCIVLFIAGSALGYYAGQEHMKPELKQQYESGQKIGHETGYADGYANGLNDGRTAAESNYKKVFEDAYRTGIANYLTNSYGGYSPYLTLYQFDFDERDNLLRELGESYGFNAASIPRPLVGKLVPIK